MRWMNCLIACLLVCACGEDNEGTPPPDDKVTYPECSVSGELVLEGTLDGQPINVRKATSGYTFLNAGISGEQARLELSAPTPEWKVVVRVEFEKLLAHGGEVPARGVVELSSEGVVAGNCSGDGFPGRIAQSQDGDTTNFVLRMLKAQPFCGGAARSGELRGCILRTRP